MSNEIWVGPTETYRTLESAVAASMAGDTIYVRAGVYAVGDTSINHALTIVGVGGEVILTSTRTLDRGLLVALADLTVENITFRGAWSASGSAAGVAVEGGDLVVRNSNFEQNETGILARDSATGSILIEDSRFAGNGWGDATTAAVVAGRGTEMLTVVDSYFLENAAGHHIVSRSAQTVIERSILDDGSAGSSGASIDLPDGGRVLIQDNVIRKGATGAGQVAVDYGENSSLAHAGSSLSVQSNVISDASGTGKAVVNGLAGTVADVSYNTTYGLAAVTEGAASAKDNLEEALPASEAATVAPSSGASAFAAAGGGSGSHSGVSAFSSEAGSSVSSVALSNGAGSTKPAGTAEISHTFARGEMPADAPLQVLLNGVLTPVTLTVQSTYDDGSIKAAALSFATPSLAAGASMQATLVRGSLTPSETGSNSGTVQPPVTQEPAAQEPATPPPTSQEPVTPPPTTQEPPAPVEIQVVTTSSGTVVTGTSGNDTYSFDPTKIKVVSVEGGAGSDTVNFNYGYSEYYKVTQNADGSISVTETHGTGRTTQLTGVETVKLGNKMYDVATGTMSSVTPPSTGTQPSPTTPTTGGSTAPSGSTGTSDSSTPTAAVTHSPAFEAGGSNIVDVAMVNSGVTARPAGFWTFGQVFKQGDLPDGDQLDAVINGQTVALQVDVKSTWDDGSVKHAILTVKTPQIAAGGSAIVELMRDTTPEATGPALTVGQMLAGDLDVKLQLDGLAGGTVVLDAKTVLAKAVADGAVKTWLAGENAIEVAVRAKINDQLEAEFDIRYHADGTYTTDVIVRNDWIYVAGVKNTAYDVKILDHGATAYSEAGVNHLALSTWHKVVSNAASLGTLYGQFDAEYLRDTGAIPGYDLTVGVTSSRLASAASANAASDTSIMGNAGIMKDMGSTGEREDIGLVTGWTANYLQSMDARAAQVMLAKADAAGSIPWHARDDQTGASVNIVDHPKLWLDYRAYGNASVEKIASPFVTRTDGWALDTSHQASLTYVPYLTTGSQYYLSELTAQAAYITASLNPGYRGYDDGLVSANQQQRGRAWGLRDVADALFALPDSDPQAAQYEHILQSNLNSMVKTYLTDGTMDKFGAIEGSFLGSAWQFGPWQEMFTLMTLGSIAERGYGQAVDLMNWSSNFTAGMFLHAEDGFNPIYGFSYQLYARDAVTGAIATTWEELYAYTRSQIYAGSDPSSTPGQPHLSVGYAADARAGMASLARIGNLDGMEAYGVIMDLAPSMMTAFSANAKYAIAFRAGFEGEDVAAADHIIGTSGDNALAGSARADVIAGRAGNDSIGGGAGGDALYGNDGHDTLRGEAGNDYLFGGAGNDILVGGAGNDVMRGGSGADQFVFDVKAFGSDQIDDFEVGIDKIIIDRSALPDGVSTTADLLARAAMDAGGNTVIDFGGGNEIVLHKIVPASLHADSFVLQ